jgi:hypothetical protein
MENSKMMKVTLDMYVNALALRKLELCELGKIFLCKSLSVAGLVLLVSNPSYSQSINKGIGQNTPIEWNTGLNYCKPNQQPPTLGHPGPQFRLTPSEQKPTPKLGISNDITFVQTAETCFPEPKYDPFTLPPGTNLLPNAYVDMLDGNGESMPNTLPSTPNIPYNLHDGHPVVTALSNAISPTDDLHSVVFGLEKSIADKNQSEVDEWLEFGRNILEGNHIKDRHYRGFPVLHYLGGTKERQVNSITKTVKVHQIWYDEHIESDSAFLDLSQLDPEDTWTIEYTVDVLNRGEDDFSPFVMYFDDPSLTTKDGKRLPHIGMDQTFFPMQQGTRTVFNIKMTRAKYLNLIYTWGWRMHPPRIQAMENSKKMFPPLADGVDTKGNPVVRRSVVAWERSVFTDTPTASEQAKVDAISKIGDLSPAKRMWNAFRSAQLDSGDWIKLAVTAKSAKDAYFDWRTRSRLPEGVEPDPESDITLLYVNNTIYGEFVDEEKPLQFAEVRWPEWKKRNDHELKVTLHNGDYYQRAYGNVDFGGARGWENQFKSSTKVGGSGCWFTFGRAHWMQNMSAIILAPSPGGVETEKHKVNIRYNYEPSTRLRFYQFDPMHHDVGIYSIH